jgi:hypothetical protein
MRPLNRPERKGLSGISVLVVVALVAIVGTASFASRGLSSAQVPQPQGSAPSTVTYSINGLTCTLPASTAPHVDSLVPKVVALSQFTSAAGGSMFVYQYSDNITDRTQITGGTLLGGPTQNGSVIGGTVVNLPPLVELTFYNYGPDTSCGQTGTPGAISLLVVQVPVEAGEFNLAAATVHLMHGVTS